MYPKSHIYAHGKLLLAGEYFVLDGATALAVPTNFGQGFDFSHKTNNKFELIWSSFDHEHKKWFEGHFSTPDFCITGLSSFSLAASLRKIFLAAQTLGATFPKGTISIQSHLEFPREWGLGTSSTLVFAIADWLKINPYLLLANTFGGSGYDIACANNSTPILYQLKSKKPTWISTSFATPFQEKIGFVFLNRKQNSREGISTYRKKEKASPQTIQAVSHLAKALTTQRQLGQFMEILDQLEEITGQHLGIPPIQQAQFSNFDGSIKSLGAWGGDFIMAVSPKGRDYIKDYFAKKGFSTFLDYKAMIKS